MQSLSNESSQAQHELDLTQCEFMLSTCACLNLRKASRAVTRYLIKPYWRRDCGQRNFRFS